MVYIDKEDEGSHYDNQQREPYEWRWRVTGGLFSWKPEVFLEGPRYFGPYLTPWVYLSEVDMCVQTWPRNSKPTHQ